MNEDQWLRAARFQERGNRTDNPIGDQLKQGLVVHHSSTLVLIGDKVLIFVQYVFGAGRVDLGAQRDAA